MPVLSGSLQTFRVQEVLGLLSRKPGCWRVDLQHDRGAYVGLQDGHLVCVNADTSRQDLARRLVIEGAVGTTSLAQGLREAGEEGVVGHLWQADLIDPEALPGLVHSHIVAALADLTHWRDGVFHAEQAQALPDDVGVRVPLAELGAEVTALLRQWRVATDRLGGLQTVIARAPGEVPPGLVGVHALIDGRRTVRDLVELSGHGAVGTVVDVAALVQAGCAAPVVTGQAAVEQQLAMLSVLEDATPVAPQRSTGPHLAVIPGGAAADEVVEPASQEDTEQDLLSVILRGVRGV